jgi:hypothetical protein
MGFQFSIIVKKINKFSLFNKYFLFIFQLDLLQIILCQTYVVGMICKFDVICNLTIKSFLFFWQNPS